MKNHISHVGETETHKSDYSLLGNPNKNIEEIPFRETWREINAEPYYYEGEYIFIREVKYPLDHKHGHYKFSDLYTAKEVWTNRDLNHPFSMKDFEMSEMVFFDTETTGLSGTGTQIFLLGIAYFTDKDLTLKQYFLPSPSSEVAQFNYFLNDIGRFRLMASYNGKSFDWPQLITRHTLVRQNVPKLPALGHFDLYHAARRLWKHKLERTNLSIVEKDVLGIDRVDDIPGYLAPMIYFDFIESRQPKGIHGIMKHNEIDILSLVTLYTHLTFQLCGMDMKQTRKESFEVGRWFAAIGEKAEAEQVLTKLVDGSDVTSLQAKLALAYHYKKEKDWERALNLFVEVADTLDVNMSLEACIETAKIYEHKLKDYLSARDYCLKASKLNEESQLSKDKKGKVNDQLQNRFFRLEKRIEKHCEICNKIDTFI
ncbi:ribonuclease H-like domain-containing protein [Neobacillus sp. FSL H8-0543]|uniref:ribonuclease H-like domain-containing protein n=1 Tax=Neobacillus sp. FSL H8-0543 TaxID=2954672 RepID=UPI00315949A1